METFYAQYRNLPKGERYAEVLPHLFALMEGETDRVTLLANVSAVLHDAFNFFWVGFYWVDNEELHLGPFQGSVACSRIKKGRGVCGTAWQEARTLIVNDVEEFPGHIACSSFSRSEIVVPLIRDGEVIGVLDIDSDELAAFDTTDQQYLETLTKKMVQCLSSTPLV